MKTDAAIAKVMVDAGAFTIHTSQPLRGPTGWLMPVYTDARVLISYVNERKQIIKALARLCRDTFPKADAIAGMATSGMPWSTWLAGELNLPFAYVRERPKRHGKQTRVEGVLTPGSNVVVFDDVINTGAAFLSGVTAVRSAGGNPIGALAISTYQLEVAVRSFQHAKLPLHTLTNLRSLLTAARVSGLAGPESEAAILEWAARPGAWTGASSGHT